MMLNSVCIFVLIFIIIVLSIRIRMNWLMFRLILKSFYYLVESNACFYGLVQTCANIVR